MGKTRALVLGLLGGVASGKSSIARLLQERGAVLLDADALCREELERPATAARVLAEFGPAAASPSGGLDRGALARRIFGDPEARRRLEALLHPPVLARLRRSLRRLRPRGGLIVLDVPLLLESGLDQECDVCILVAVPARVRERRARLRGWPPGERARREKCQAGMKAKASRADYVLQNDGSLEESRVRLETLMLEVGKGGTGRRG